MDWQCKFPASVRWESDDILKDFLSSQLTVFQSFWDALEADDKLFAYPLVVEFLVNGGTVAHVNTPLKEKFNTLVEKIWT